MQQGRLGALGIIVTSLAIVGLVMGFPGLSILLNGAWGFVMFGMAALGGLIYVLLSVRLGKNLVVSLLILALFSTLAFSVTLGAMRYLLAGLH